MRIEELGAYEIIEKKHISDLNSESYILKHRKTGARIALLSNDDENKVFYIGFRTPPTDSTGVAHIIEHTVLCGSRDFPIKDPFIELAKGSLNTFLNAMTYPDKTVYPVASCNDADFQNLLHVYLDAVFYPNIYKTDKIFKQEGWHYEIEDEQSDLVINGVVYNEMKGAFSSPDDVLDREILNSLFPDTTYAIESGGDPDVIPDLTYQQYLNFHKKYYHPSNSYIYLYGNMDMTEKLQYIDENYLSAFAQQKVDSEVPLQTAFDKPIEIHKQYSIMQEESEKENTYLSYNACVGTSLDRKLYIAFDVLDYALCSAPGAVLKKALIDKGIGRDVYSEYENGIRQPFFSVVAKNADPEQKEEFVRIIRECLTEQVQKGLDKKALLAGINYDEFKYREADFGRFPKGLLYGLQVLDSWLYDDRQPWIHIEAGDTFKQLKEEVKGKYFEDLIQKYLLDNSHETILLLEPVKNLTQKKDEALRSKLAEYRAGLSTEEINRIISETRELKEYQEAPDKPEDLARIPLLTRADMKKEAEQFHNAVRYAGKTKILFHDIYTNGIGYVNFIFDMKDVPEDLFPYAGILKTVLGMVDTQHYTYGDLYNEINIRTGGINASVNTYSEQARPKHYMTTFEISVKVLHENLHWAFELLQEILLYSKIDDKKRLKEILDEKKSHMQSALTSAGHQTAAVRALSYVSQTARISDMMSGIDAYRLVEKLCDDYSEKAHHALAEKLIRLAKILFRGDNLMLDYTTPEDDYAGIELQTQTFVKALYQTDEQKGGFVSEPGKKNEAFQTAGQVQYVCRAGNFREKGLPYTGALRVLKVMMGYDYLWTNIRVKGGAYGCMSGYSRNGDAYFVTYRDPHLKRSIEVFEKTSAYLRSYDADERTITQFIIGAIGDLDTPKTPSAKGTYALSAYLCGLSMEDIQKDRNELLSVSVETIRRMADYVDAFLRDDCICVVGSSEKIKQDSRLFDSIDQLIRSGSEQEEE